MTDPGQPIEPTPELTATEPASILFICTANRIRSPFAAAVARSLITENGLPLMVSSAGLDQGGLPAMEPMVKVASRWGIDLRDHVSRQLTAELIANSDLMVTMTGAHVVELAGEYPEGLSRLVTLREAAAATQLNGSPGWTAAATQAWVAQVAQRPLDVLLSGNVDVADPVGSPKRVYKRTAGIIAELVEQLLAPLPAPSGSA